MGLCLTVEINKKCLTKMDLGYAGFFWLRNEIAKLNGFEYAYQEMTNIPNLYFNRNEPENRLNNSKFIPKYDAPLLLKIPKTTTLNKIEMRHLHHFLIMSDIEGKLPRSYVRSLWKILENEESKNLNVQTKYNKFKNILKIAKEKNAYIKWE